MSAAPQAKHDNAVALTKRVMQAKLQERNAPRPRSLSKAQGQATKWSRRCMNILIGAVEDLEGAIVDDEEITPGKVRGMVNVVEALFAHHRRGCERTGQFACVWETHFESGYRERGLK
jgi:hypothetical protein